MIESVASIYCSWHASTELETTTRDYTYWMVKKSGTTCDATVPTPTIHKGHQWNFTLLPRVRAFHLIQAFAETPPETCCCQLNSNGHLPLHLVSSTGTTGQFVEYL